MRSGIQGEGINFYNGLFISKSSLREAALRTRTSYTDDTFGTSNVHRLGPLWQQGGQRPLPTCDPWLIRGGECFIFACIFHDSGSESNASDQRVVEADGPVGRADRDAIGLTAGGAFAATFD